MEELDLKELFNMFWSRKVIIAIITAVFMVIGIIYTYFFVTPDYQSRTTIILAQSASKSAGTATEPEATITTNDLTLNQKLVSTYSELIKSKNIVRDVKEHLQLNKSEEAIKNSITVSTVKDTDLIEIKVRDEDPEQAKLIAEEVANVFIDKVADGVYNINNVQVWDKAELNSAPYNINHKKDIAIFILIGLVVSSVYVLIANMLDTTVKSKEDIEDKVGLSVLTTIPVCDFEFNSKSNKGGRK